MVKQRTLMYANNRGWNYWGEPAPPICSNIGRAQPPPSENEGTNPSKLLVKRDHRLQHRPKDYLTKRVWEFVRGPSLDELFSIISARVFLLVFVMSNKDGLEFFSHFFFGEVLHGIAMSEHNHADCSQWHPAISQVTTWIDFSRKYAFSCF